MTGSVLKLLVCISLSASCPGMFWIPSKLQCREWSFFVRLLSAASEHIQLVLSEARFSSKTAKKVPWETGRQKWQKKQAEATSPKPLLIVVSTFNRTSVTVNENKHCQGRSEQPGSVTSCILFSDPAWVLWWWGKRPECFPLHHRETQIQALPFPPLNKPRTLNHLSFLSVLSAVQNS